MAEKKIGVAKKAKFAMVERLAKEIEGKKTVMVVDLTGMPSKNLSAIRRELKGKASFKITKKIVIKKALEKANKGGFDRLVDEVAKSQPALVLSDENPFRISRVILNHVTNAPAKAGQVPDSDIVVLKGDTGLPPGPAIGELQKANLPARIEKGKIVVGQDTVVAKAGHPVSKEVAEALLKLGMEPFKIKLNVRAAWDEGSVYYQNHLFLTTEEVFGSVSTCHSQAVNLAVVVGWTTKETLQIILAKAVREASALGAKVGNQDNKAEAEASASEGGKA